MARSAGGYEKLQRKLKALEKAYDAEQARRLEGAKEVLRLSKILQQCDGTNAELADSVAVAVGALYLKDRQSRMVVARRLGRVWGFPEAPPPQESPAGKALAAMLEKEVPTPAGPDGSDSRNDGRNDAAGGSG